MLSVLCVAVFINKNNKNEKKSIHTIHTEIALPGLGKVSCKVSILQAQDRSTSARCNSKRLIAAENTRIFHERCVDVRFFNGTLFFISEKLLCKENIKNFF